MFGFGHGFGVGRGGGVVAAADIDNWTPAVSGVLTYDPVTGVFTKSAGGWTPMAHSDVAYSGDVEIKLSLAGPLPPQCMIGLDTTPRTSDPYYGHFTWITGGSGQNVSASRPGGGLGSSAGAAIGVRRIGSTIEWFTSASGDFGDEVVDFTYPDPTGGAPLYIITAHTNALSWGPVIRSFSSSQRFAAALAHPTPREIAAVDPIASATEVLFNDSPSGIAGAVTHTFAGGLIRPLHGKAIALGGDLIKIVSVHVDNVTPAPQRNTGIEVLYTGRRIAFEIAQGYGPPMHAFVDGVLTSDAGYALLDDNYGGGWFVLDFGTSAQRRIRIEGEGRGIYGRVQIEPTGTLSDPAAVRPCNLMIVGDSFVYPAWPDHELNGFPQILAEELGIDNMIPAPTGGLGFLNNASTNFTLRIANDLTLVPDNDPRLDAIAVFISGNDSGLFGDGTAHLAAVIQVLDACRTAWPGAVTMGLGSYSKEGTGLPVLMSMEANMEAACVATGALYVPGMPQMMSAAPGTWFSPGDGAHPTNTGHIGLGQGIAALIRDAWAGLA